MATFIFSKEIDIGTKGYPTAGSWEVATDINFVNILDSTYEDKDSIYKWISPLPKIDGTGYHADLDNLYVRVKIHIFNTVSDWFYLKSKNQNEQIITYTKNGKVVRVEDALTIGFN